MSQFYINESTGGGITPIEVCSNGSTTGTGSVDILTYPVTLNNAFTVQGLVVGRSTDGFAIGAEIISNGKNTAGTVTLLDEGDLTRHSETALDDALIEVIASGGNLVIRGTGVTGKTINWRCCIEYVEVS